MRRATGKALHALSATERRRRCARASERPPRLRHVGAFRPATAGLGPAPECVACTHVVARRMWLPATLPLPLPLCAEARQNSRRFGSASAEAAALIYNYSPVTTGDSYRSRLAARNAARAQRCSRPPAPAWCQSATRGPRDAGRGMQQTTMQPCSEAPASARGASSPSPSAPPHPWPHRDRPPADGVGCALCARGSESRRRHSSQQSNGATDYITCNKRMACGAPDYITCNKRMACGATDYITCNKRMACDAISPHVGACRYEAYFFPPSPAAATSASAPASPSACTTRAT
jgi:hypothetical protein